MIVLKVLGWFILGSFALLAIFLIIGFLSWLQFHLERKFYEWREGYGRKVERRISRKGNRYAKKT